MKNAYLVSVIGVGLMAVMTAYNLVRAAVMTRPMFQASTGAAEFAGRRQFGMNAFGLSNGLTIIALVVAIVGLVWLGLAVKKSHQNSPVK
jgi:TctA family transporter